MAQDWKEMSNMLAGSLSDELLKLVDGSIEDLNGPVRAAANRLAIAVRRGKAGESLLPEIRDQLMMELVAKQIQAKTSFNKVFDVVLGVGINMLFQGATGALMTLKKK